MCTKCEIQTMTGEVLPFTLPEESEIADLKGQIANHYEVNLDRIVLSTKNHTPEEGDTFIVCKDYGEVESDATYYLFINSLPSYQLVVQDGLIQFLHPSGENPSIYGAHQPCKYWDRKYSPDQPYEIQIHLKEEDCPLLVEHLRTYYQTMPLDNFVWMDMEAERPRHLANITLLLQTLQENITNLSYLTEEFISTHIGRALGMIGRHHPYTLSYI